MKSQPGSEQDASTTRRRPLLNPDRTVTNLLRRYRLRLAAVAALSFAGGSIEAVFLVLLTRTAFAISEGQDRFGVIAGIRLTMPQVVLIGLVLVSARFVLAASAAAVGSALTARVTADLRLEVGSAYLEADFPTQHDDPNGQLQTLLTNFAGSGAVIVNAVVGLLTSGFNLAAMLTLALLLDAVSAVLVLIALGLLAVVLRPFRAAVRRQSSRASKANLAYASQLDELSDIGMELHVFDVHRQAGDRVARLVARQADIDRRMRLYSGLVPIVYTALAYLAMLTAIAAISLSGAADLRTAGAVLLLMLRSLTYGQALQTGITQISAQRGWVTELAERFRRYGENRRLSDGAPVRRVGVIELCDVSFEYVDGQPVFENVNLSLERGEIVGIVGPSGGGKSTLVQLILGLRQPTSGQVLVDGRDVGSLGRHDWSRRVTFVPQRPRLISGTIRENIVFFRSDVDDEQVTEAARRANLLDDVSSWPEGFDRQVGDSGSRLSGGQQQRVSIARALVEDPDVMILDEPTSALDEKSELAVRDTLDALRGEVTVLVIAHRPATVQICDRVLEVRNQRVVEQSHAREA